MFFTTRIMMSSTAKQFSFKKIPDFQHLASPYFELREVTKDCFSPSIVSNSRELQSSAAYGGVLLGQALAAAEKTVEERFQPHSTHAYFILSVDTKEPLTYKVDRVRDGRAFATRTVTAVQNDSVRFMLQCSFHVPEKESIVHQSSMPKVAAPETLLSMRDAVPYIKSLREQGKLRLEPAMKWRLEDYDASVYADERDLFDMRCTNLGNYYGFSSDLKPELYFWMRARGDLKAGDERLHRYLVAYISDSLPAFAAFGPHQSIGFQPSLTVSLDHCLWFHHADIRADEWLLFECRSRVASGARTLIEGRIWRRDGVLMASCQQEALVRSSQESKI